MMPQKQKCFDKLLIFILISTGSLLGGLAFGAPHWLGTLVFLMMGVFLLTAGIYLAILECVAKRLSRDVDDRKEL